MESDDWAIGLCFIFLNGLVSSGLHLVQYILDSKEQPWQFDHNCNCVQNFAGIISTADSHSVRPHGQNAIRIPVERGEPSVLKVGEMSGETHS